MNHDEAVREKFTERYFLAELDPEQREQFEEHLFDCQECALDFRAGATFLEESKVLLADASTSTVVPARPVKSSWFGWLRPAFAVPVMALLVIAIGYQNFVQVPRLLSSAAMPQALPFATLNVSTRGVEKTAITMAPGQGFNLVLSIPPDPAYTSYTLDLYKPVGGLKWSLKIPASSPDDTHSIYIPGSGLEQGTYKLTVNGITAAGQSTSIGNYPVELKIQK